MQQSTLSLPAAFAANHRPSLPPPPLPLPPGCHRLNRHHLRKRQQQQHHQRTNGSTNLKSFTSPDDLDLFNSSTVFEVCDDGQGNLVAIC
jgi:hypothetical protein